MHKFKYIVVFEEPYDGKLIKGRMLFDKISLNIKYFSEIENRNLFKLFLH